MSAGAGTVPSEPPRRRLRLAVFLLVGLAAVVGLALLWAGVDPGDRDAAVRPAPAESHDGSVVELPAVWAVEQVRIEGAPALLEGGEVWARASLGDAAGIWHLTGGEGIWYQTRASFVVGPAVGPDGRAWIVLLDRLLVFDGDAWREATRIGSLADDLEVAPDGTVWISAQDELLRFDGELVRFPVPWTMSYPLGDIAVTTDGTVWGGGFSGWVPTGSGLTRFDGYRWHAVTPFEGKHLPAIALAATDDGGLWALLHEWRWRMGLDPPRLLRWVLARFDGSGWSTYVDGLPDGAPSHLAARDGVVWVSGEWGDLGFLGVWRFDGERWSLRSDRVPMGSVALAPDGGVWAVDLEGELVRIERAR